MIHAVLFDLDETLLDRQSSLIVYLHRQFRRLRELQSVAFTEYMNRVVELDAHGYANKDEVFRCVEREFDLSPGTWKLLLEDFLAYFPHICVPFPKAHQTLATLRQQGLKLGLVTNGRVASQQPKIDGLGISGYFDTVLISESEGIAKPDPEIFLRAVGSLGISVEEAVMVGDNPAADVGGAKECGMRAIWKRGELARTTRRRRDNSGS